MYNIGIDVSVLVQYYGITSSAMVHWDVYICMQNMPKEAKISVDKIQLMTYKNLLHRVEYFGLSGASMKALPEDEFRKVNANNKHTFLEPSSRNVCLMELLEQPSLPILVTC